MSSTLSRIFRLCTVHRHLSGEAAMTDTKRWRPLGCLEGNAHPTCPDADQACQVRDSKIAVIVLNQPLKSMYPHLLRLWDKAVLKAAADGGANRLCEFRTGNQLKFIPDIISGDFDSIRPEVLLFYKSKGSKVIETADQNFTDFTKCLRIVLDVLEQKKQQVDCIVALGSFGGRPDQVFANINTLYEATEVTDIPVYLVADDSLACLLRPGKHVIEVNTGLEGEWCGLVPVGFRCKYVTTTGLKWNLNHQSMQFGSLISTSNTYAEGAKEVTVQTDQPLLWTMGIRPITVLKSGVNGAGASSNGKGST
ncbi:thiamine pyrophosphokinase 1-like [Amphiura filiformis]|uniref:thiamine pyrophosphokinase 1-like n=1 Tax=Amphiura filiformis TaxID=82378 RepID=UPI003B226E3F